LGQRYFQSRNTVPAAVHSSAFIVPASVQRATHLQTEIPSKLETPVAAVKDFSMAFVTVADGRLESD